MTPGASSIARRIAVAIALLLLVALWLGRSGGEGENSERAATRRVPASSTAPPDPAAEIARSSPETVVRETSGEASGVDGPAGDLGRLLVHVFLDDAPLDVPLHVSLDRIGPIAGYGRQRPVDQAGVAEFADLVPGSYVVQLQYSKKVRCRIGAGQTSTVRIDLRSNDQVDVVVVDPDGVPLEEAVLRLVASSSFQIIEELATDADGRTSFFLEEGPSFFDIEIAKDGFRTLRRDALRFDDLTGSGDVRFVLEPGGVALRLSFTGAPPAGTKWLEGAVSQMTRGCLPVHFVVQPSEEIHVSGLVEGVALIELRSPRGLLRREPVQLVAPETSATVALDWPCGDVAGEVLDAEELPVEGAIVRFGAPFELGFQEEVSDEAGQFRFRDLPAGPSRLFVRRGRENVSVPVTVREGTTARVTARLGATVRGRLLDRQGRGVEGATVQVRTRDAGGPSSLGAATTGPDGSFDIRRGAATQVRCQWSITLCEGLVLSEFSGPHEANRIIEHELDFALDELGEARFKLDFLGREPWGRVMARRTAGMAGRATGEPEGLRDQLVMLPVGADGVCRFECLPPGEYEWTLGEAGRLPQRLGGALVRPEGSVDLGTIEVFAAGVIRFRATSDPPRSVTLEASAGRAPPSRRGWQETLAVPPGSYRIVFHFLDGEPSVTYVRVRSDEEVTVEVADAHPLVLRCLDGGLPVLIHTPGDAACEEARTWLDAEGHDRVEFDFDDPGVRDALVRIEGLLGVELPAEPPIVFIDRRPITTFDGR